MRRARASFEYTVDGALPCLVHSVLFADCRGIGAAGCLAFRANRRESRKRIHAQTRLLIQHRLVEQRDEFDNIFCSIRDGLITYDTDLRIHFVNRPLLQMLGLSSETYTSRFYEGQMAGSISGFT